MPDIAHRLASTQFAEEVVRGLDGFDALQVEGLEMAGYYLGRRGKMPPVVFDDHNAEYRLQWSIFRIDAAAWRRWPGAGYSLIQWLKLRAYERKVCRAARAIVAVALEDKEALLCLDHSLKITVVSNAIDPGYFQGFRPQAMPGEINILFTGTMDYRPNVDAVNWFCHQIWPHIEQRVPQARFLIVGRSPTQTVQKLATNQIIVTGEVDDVRPYLARSALYVAPLRMGGGVRFKVLEAMASGVPVVSTTEGMRGIAALPGREVAIADEPRVFASQVVDLLRDEGMRHSRAEAARRLVLTRYQWSVVMPRLERLYTGLTNERR